MPSDTYILTISEAGVSVPSTGSVTNTSVAADAAIAFSKLEPLTNGNIIVGNSSDVPTSVAVTGDVTISNTGVTSIATGSIINDDINSSAGIAHSKLATTTAGNVLIGNAAGSVTGTPITGDISVSSTGAATINNNAVTLSKLQTVSDYQILGRNTGVGTGNVQSISCTPFAFSLLDDANASTARTTLGLGSMATQNSSSVNITGGTISVNSLSFSTPLSATSGGTGQSSYAVGDLLYANTTTSVAKLADVAAGNVLLSGGVGIAPSYGKVGLTTHVTGILPIENGGTGTNTGANFNLSNATGILPTAKGGTGVDISQGSGFIFVDNGVVGATPQINLSNAVSSTLPVANGGTGTATIDPFKLLIGPALSGSPIAQVDTGASGSLLMSNGSTGQPSWVRRSRVLDTVYSTQSTGASTSPVTLKSTTLPANLFELEGDTVEAEYYLARLVANNSSQTFACSFNGTGILSISIVASVATNTQIKLKATRSSSNTVRVAYTFNFSHADGSSTQFRNGFVDVTGIAFGSTIALACTATTAASTAPVTLFHGHIEFKPA